MKRFILFLLLSTILVCAVLVLFLSPVFTLKQLRIEGGSLDGEVIRQLSGIREGKNILFLRTGDAVAALEADARIERASIRKMLPDTVVIKLETRDPFVSLQSDLGPVVLDKTGRIIQVGQDQAAIPRLEGFRVRRTIVGDPVSTADALMLTKALNLADLLSQTALSDVRIVNQSGELVLQLNDKYQVRFGHAEQIEKQFSDFMALYEKLARDNTFQGMIDVSSTKFAVYKPFE